MPLIIIPIVPRIILRDHLQALTVCFGVAVGASSRRTAVRPIAAAARWTAGSSAWASGLCSPQVSSKAKQAERASALKRHGKERGTIGCGMPWKSDCPVRGNDTPDPERQEDY